ncbi:MAG TPA: LutB/LldF family L-lactate oxidation iron-sulfur protein [bacterium]|nr:LutB/LldF family L-lactate oxidation iron-sulfur protein [bacterium]
MTADHGQEAPIEFVENARRALADPSLQANLSRSMHAFRENRARVLEDFAGWETWREQARAIKAHTLAHLDHYLDRFDRSVRAAGGQVHWAADAADARRIIGELARRHGVRRIVKSKSSTTDEIELNPSLERAGLEVTETDLGEFIVQVAGESPIHFVGPALHKSAHEVGTLFADKIGAPRTDEPEALTRAARAYLRERFLRAEMGLSGVNFGVADTGTLVVFENEGNARMVTTLPRVHVALMGMEKLVPDLASLAVMLRVLPISATGGRMAEYVSLITGPRRQGEADGPEELHVVVLDNGRSRILADTEVRESLQCLRCGACLNVCPVYERAGGHAYGSIYSGPIGAVLTPLYRGLAQAGTLPFASSLCGYCAEVCPVKIDLPRLLLVMRRRAVAAGEAVTDVERLGMRAFAWAASSARRWALAGRALRAMLRPFVRGDRIRHLPGPLGGWTRHRDFPAPPRGSFQEGAAAHRGDGDGA